MANKVIQNNEVFLDGKYYPINRPERGGVPVAFATKDT